jgi:type IX secretion system PorP/SprF family membrane protein
MKLKSFFTVIIFLFSTSLFAQDAQFTQHFSTGIYNNPASTGSVGKARLSAAYRFQKVSNYFNYQTSFLSFDISKEKLPVDIGVFTMYDRVGAGALNTIKMGVSVGRSFKIYKSVSIRLGLSGALANRRLKTMGLFYGDAVASANNYKINYPVINYGMLLQSNTILLGFSANNINQPNYDFFSLNSRLPINYVVQIAARLTMNTPENLNGLYLSIFYSRQSDDINFLPGLIFRYKSFKVGAAVSTFAENSIVFNAAYTGKQLGVAYSFINDISKLTNNQVNSHEFSLNWTFGKQNEKRPGIGFISSLF